MIFVLQIGSTAMSELQMSCGNGCTRAGCYYSFSMSEQVPVTHYWGSVAEEKTCICVLGRGVTGKKC